LDRLHVTMLEWLVAADRALAAWFVSWQAHPVLDRAFLFLTQIGAASLVWLAIIVVGWVINPTKRAALWRAGMALLVTFVLVDHVLKPYWARPRPFTSNPQHHVLGPMPVTLSFPSGHAASSAAGATALTRVWPHAAVPFWLLAVLIACSRLYLGVHYPSDILGGFVVGILVALFVTASRPCYTRNSA
jgi:undecaprenyl-diphosphatase